MVVKLKNVHDIENYAHAFDVDVEYLDEIDDRNNNPYYYIHFDIDYY